MSTRQNVLRFSSLDDAAAEEESSGVPNRSRNRSNESYLVCSECRYADSRAAEEADETDEEYVFHRVRKMMTRICRRYATS